MTSAPSPHPSLMLLRKPFVVMGILNVTPDSFYDGGRYARVESSLDQARSMIADGANIIDIGGESSRPGAKPVLADEEIERVVPVVEKIRAESDIPLSIDTTKAVVARAALDAGGTWLNDISAGRFDSAMAPLAAERRCPVVLMHSRKKPETMQVEPHYDNVVTEVKQELLAGIQIFLTAGVPAQNIIIDPGIGFAKRLDDNIELLRNTEEITSLGYPVLVGASRKSSIGTLTGRPVEERLAGSLAAAAAAYLGGAKILRVHDVRETVDFLKVLSTIHPQRN